MCKKEEAIKEILDFMIIIENIEDKNIPINNFNENDLVELHKTRMKSWEGVNYSKEIES